MTTAAARQAVARYARSRWLQLALASGTAVLAVVGTVGAIASRSSVAANQQARTTAASIGPRASRERTLLTTAYRRRSRAARGRFFAAAQREATLLSALEGTVPGRLSPRVSRIVGEHDAALVAAARAFRADAGAARSLGRARTLLGDVEQDGAAIFERIDAAGPPQWPSSAVQRLEAGALVLTLLAGIVVIAGVIRRAAGLGAAPETDGREIERLTHAMRSDTMTGLENRRAFHEDLSKMIERRNASGTPFSLLAFDLDGLKRLNDAQGHAAGDSYIRSVADCLREELGSIGTVYRTGGDEFMALLPGSRGWHALTIAHNLQRSTHRATGRRALSIGITESTKTEGRRLLLHQADVALYEAKRGQLLAVTYHTGLEPDVGIDSDGAPSQQQKALAAALARAVDAKDAGTRNHSETVSELCVAIGTRLGISGARLERLRLAGLLHDVGKIGVSDAILAKRGALAPKERSEIELHATVGHSILTSAELHEEAVWVLHHHERYDGTGYPTGLAGEEIPRESRVIAVADAFEAMTGARPYRIATTTDKALDELVRNSGTQFDPACVQALDDLFGGEAGRIERELEAAAAADDISAASA